MHNFSSNSSPDIALNLDLLEQYKIPTDGSYDEMCATQGTVRKHWAYLSSTINTLGSAELSEREREIHRRLRDNGVTYNAYNEAGEANRPWQLDPVPLLIDSHEWTGIERGLLQRAEVFNLLLKDLFGPAEVLKKNILPPELLYSHSTFLRACHSTKISDKHYLHLCATDLARSPGGMFHVVGDRPGGLAGAGYVLENRIVLSRIMPSLFRDSQVHRLVEFYRCLRRTLLDASRRQNEDSRIVVLTPGPDSENYFEHAYLAKYLGYTLVQGGDLSVRDGRVWLKTLDGLQAVDVILRWQDGDMCDPLELRSDAPNGVAGLLQAMRLKNVAVLNPPAADWVANRALMQFMPGLCRHFLGEDIILPSPPTLWCGRRRELEHVLENLHRLVIRRTLPTPGQTGIRGIFLNDAERARLRTEILKNPHLYVGQEEVSRSTAPVFHNGKLEPRQMVLRTFTVADKNGWHVMPGGLTRMSPGEGLAVVSEYSGGLTKDTWVLASEPEKQDSMVTEGGLGFKLPGGHGELPSRVAENLFWLGRYTERSEGVARLLRGVLQPLINPPEYDESGNLRHLLPAITHITETYPGFAGDDAAEQMAAPEKELMSVLLERSRVGSLSYNLDALLYAARAVRDRISPDIWRVFNDVEEGLERFQRHASALPTGLLNGNADILNEMLDELNDLILSFAAFNGLSIENMTHGQGWRFLIIGRRLERAQFTTRLLRAVLCEPPPNETVLLEQLLTVSDSLMTYRNRYRTHIQIEPILDLLLQDETNPRSLSYQLERVQYFVSELPRDSIFSYKSKEERLVLEALSQLRLADPRELMQCQGDSGVRTSLDRLLLRLNHLLPQISDAVGKSYFSHTVPPRQLVGTEESGKI